MASYHIEPPSGLQQRIMHQIRKEQRALAVRKTVIFSATTAASLFGFFPALKMLLADSSQSGFFSFSSMLFSDFSSVLRYWQSFGMVLLETLPAIGLALVLAAAITFLQSAISLTKNLRYIIKVKSI